MTEQSNYRDSREFSRREFCLALAVSPTLNLSTVNAHEVPPMLFNGRASLDSSFSAFRTIFGSYAKDTHIVTALSYLTQTTHDFGTWNNNLLECTGCDSSAKPRLWLEGYVNRKNNALAHFDVIQIDGYILSPPEVALARLLIMSKTYDR